MDAGILDYTVYLLSQVKWVPFGRQRESVSEHVAVNNGMHTVKCICKLIYVICDLLKHTRR